MKRRAHAGETASITTEYGISRAYTRNGYPKGHIVSLATRLAEPPAPKTTQTILDRWIDSLPAADQEAVRKAILDPAWRHVDLQKVLEDEGAPKIAETTFGDWRRKRGYRR